MDRQHPTTPTEVKSTQENQSFFERKRNRLVAAGLAMGIGVAALTGCGPNAEAKGPTQEVTQSIEATPSVSETTPEASIEVTSESLLIPADLSVEQLAITSGKLWDEWVFAGATDETLAVTDRGFDDFNGTIDEYIAGLAQKNADLYSSAFLGENWQDDPSLVGFYNNTVEANKMYIEIGLKRYMNDEPMIKVVEHESDITELPAPEGQRIIQYTLSGKIENSTSQYIGGIVKRTFDISSGSALLIAYENQPDLSTVQ